MTEVSNIDELLTAQTGPRAPEMQPEELPEPEDSEVLDARESTNTDYDEPEPEPEKASDADDDNREETKKNKQSFDEYGNPKAEAKTYSEEEVNERINKAIRERLSRGSNGQQAQQQQPKDQEFAYNPESSENWEQQLERFVEQTVSRMGQKQVQQQHEQREADADMQFREKFTQGMGRFNDFRDVVEKQPVTDHMTLALRGIKDPSAFIYAASKRHPAELQRISQLPDSYAQIVEIGRLEERMRKAAPATSAPKPVSRTHDDGITIQKPKKKEETIEDLIASSDAKRKAALNARRGVGGRR